MNDLVARVVCFGATVFAYLVAFPFPARADLFTSDTIVFGVDITPSPVMILQNNAGTVTFTVNFSFFGGPGCAPGQLGICVTKGNVDPSSLQPSIQFTGGDNQDQLVPTGAGALVPGGTCFGFKNGNVNQINIFTMNQSCTFIVSFSTLDARVNDPLGDPDNIPGNYALNEGIKVIGLDKNSLTVDSLLGKASFNAVVLDPVPEPASVGLLGTAILV